MIVESSFVAGALAYYFPYSPIWDIVRCLLAAMAGFIIWSMVLYFKRTRRDDWSHSLALITVSNSLIQVFFILTMLDNIGEPVLWYRLPFMLVIDALICYEIYVSQKERGAR